MDKEKMLVKLIVATVLFVLTFGLAWFVKICWNAVIPYLFGLPTLTYWKAFALEWLIGLLFGKFNTETDK